VGRELNRGSKPQATTPAQPAIKPQTTTTVVQATTVTNQNEHQCKPKHNKGKGWAKGHDKHC
jgi:hypothetical protein